MAAFDLKVCLEQARHADQDAACALVEHLYPLVTRIVRAHQPRRMAEEDLAQEVFVKLFARLEQYAEREGVPFEHWVARLAVRTCLDSLRAAHRRPELRWADLSEPQTDWLEYLLATRAVAPDTAATEAREVLEKLLEQLPPQDRLVISLLDLEEKSVREISTLTGWSVTLVKVRAFRARRRLRKIAAVFKNRTPYE